MLRTSKVFRHAIRISRIAPRPSQDEGIFPAHVGLRNSLQTKVGLSDRFSVESTVSFCGTVFSELIVHVLAV